MQVAARPYFMAGAMLAAASLVAVTPIAQRAIKLPTLSIETQLVDGVLAQLGCRFELLGRELWVPSSTNLWGIDTGDPTMVALLTNVFAPFPALNQGLGGLQYQIGGFLAAQLPVSDSCDAETCFPMSAAAKLIRTP
jgi:hypothetical protein